MQALEWVNSEAESRPEYDLWRGNIASNTWSSHGVGKTSGDDTQNRKAW